jgi:uncharacterized delta-60 repeat protein
MLTRTIFMALLVMGLGQGAGAQIVEQWAAIYYGPSGYIDGAQWVALDSTGNVYITGYESGVGTGRDYVIIKYDGSGQQQWVRTYNGAGNVDDYSMYLALDSQNNVVVTGCSTGLFDNLDIVTIKYDDDGHELWRAFWDNPSYNPDYVAGLVVDSQDNVYVVGYFGFNNIFDMLLIKYNSTGQLVWSTNYAGPEGYSDKSTGLALDNSGNIYITGYSMNSTTSSDCDAITIKFDSTGHQIWTARFNGTANLSDRSYCLRVDAEGNAYIAGYTFISTFYSRYLTIKYDPAGQQTWVRFFDLTGEDENKAYHLALDGNGHVCVTGSVQLQFGTVMYTTEGTEQWSAFYHGPALGADIPTDVAMDIQGNAYVTGYSFGGMATDVDWATIKYNAQGETEWITRFDMQGGQDYPYKLCLDDSGHIYVTGSSWGGTSNYDCVTIKYAQTGLELQINLTALFPPIIIPANGGSFQFTIEIHRMFGLQAPFIIWSRLKNPDETYSNPLLGPITINPPVGVIITRLRSQTIPGSSAAGEYTYLGYVNTTYSYPAIDSSSFTFTKSTAGDDGPTIWETTCTGELFPGEALSSQPSAFSLLKCSPNPFNPTTAISYQLSAVSQVNLKVYDTSGRLVAKFVDGMQAAGMHSVTFDGSGLTSGIYLAKLEVGDFSTVQKLVLIK